MTLGISLATCLFDQTFVSHSTLCGITCTFVTGGIMMNRRQL